MCKMMMHQSVSFREIHIKVNLVVIVQNMLFKKAILRMAMDCFLSHKESGSRTIFHKLFETTDNIDWAAALCHISFRWTTASSKRGHEVNSFPAAMNEQHKHWQVSKYVSQRRRKTAPVLRFCTGSDLITLTLGRNWNVRNMSNVRAGFILLQDVFSTFRILTRMLEMWKTHLEVKWCVERQH